MRRRYGAASGGIEYNDLRWLIRRGLVGHAVATPSANGTLAFRRQASLTFTSNSRIALSSAGVKVARELIETGALRASQVLELAGVDDGRSAPGPPASERSPNWNPHRGELKLGNLVVKRLTLVTADEEVVLATFEELAWPERIDVPLHAGSHEAARLRLQKSVQALNRQPRELIRFQQDECTGGVRWELTHGDSPCGA
ncbi:MAG: hypothetical protein WD845_08045 [Pirellulales bacterium]